MESNLDKLYASIRADWERFLTMDREVIAGPVETSPAPVIDVWTMQMGKWRAAKAYEIEIIDITAKSGIPAFAPSWENLRLYKQGQMTPEIYAGEYLGRMKASFDLRPQIWARLKTKRKVAWTCYCKAGEFCHRRLFKDMAEVYLIKSGYDVRYHGELTK